MIHSQLKRNRFHLFKLILERIIETNVIDSVAKIKICEPTVAHVIGGIVGFKTSVKPQNKKVKSFSSMLIPICKISH